MFHDLRVFQGLTLSATASECQYPSGGDFNGDRSPLSETSVSISVKGKREPAMNCASVTVSFIVETLVHPILSVFFCIVSELHNGSHVLLVFWNLAGGGDSCTVAVSDRPDEGTEEHAQSPYLYILNPSPSPAMRVVRCVPGTEVNVLIYSVGLLLWPEMC